MQDQLRCVVSAAELLDTPNEQTQAEAPQLSQWRLKVVVI